MLRPPPRSRTAILAAALFAMPGSASLAAQAQPATPADPLTLVAAARSALANHPSVTEVRARVRSAEADVDEAGSSRLPTINVSGSATRYQEPMVVTPIHGFTPNQTPPFDRTLVQGGGNLTYTLWDGGGRGARIEASRNRASATRAGLSEAEQSLLTEVANAYLRILTLDGVLEAHEQRIRALEAELERVEDLRDVGRAARVDRLRVESALAGAEAERVAVSTDLRVAEAGLARLTGFPPNQISAQLLRPVDPPPDPPPPVDSLRARARTRSPALERARSEVEAAEAGLSVARSARWPRLVLDGNLLHWGSEDDLSAATEWNAGVRISVPLFSGGAISSRMAKAEAERDATRERLRLNGLRAEQEVDAALSSWREARARIQSLEIRARSMEEVARIEALRVETGAGTQSEYLDAEAALLEARAALTRARHAAVGARVRLARVQGDLTVEWLDHTLGGDR